MQKTGRELHDGIRHHIAEFDLATHGLYKPTDDYPVITLRPAVAAMLDQYASVQGIGRDLAANELLRSLLGDA